MVQCPITTGVPSHFVPVIPLDQQFIPSVDIAKEGESGVADVVEVSVMDTTGEGQTADLCTLINSQSVL